MIFSEFLATIMKHGLEAIGLYYGEYEAIVADREDPENRGRIKVICPALYGEDEVFEQWVHRKGTFAGKKTGLYAQPKKDDVVYITCRGGNPNYPLWQYGWYPKNFSPPNAHHDIYSFTTPAGHYWMIDEKNNKIVVEYANGKMLSIDTSKVKLGGANGAFEPAVLGNKNETALNDIKSALTALQAFAAATQAAAVEPTLGPAASTLSTTLTTLLTTLATDIAATKSQVVEIE